MSNNWMERADKVVMNTYGRQPLVLVKGARLPGLGRYRQGVPRLPGRAGGVQPGPRPPGDGQGRRGPADPAGARLQYLLHHPHGGAGRSCWCNCPLRTGSFSPTAAPKSTKGPSSWCGATPGRRFGAGRHRIICMENSFHGRTLGALSATGQDKFRKGFDPLLAGFVFVPFNDLEARGQGGGRQRLRRAAGAHPGRRRRLPAVADYLQGVRQLCDEKGLLLVLDEIQTGLGRTGKLFAHENYRHHAGRHDPGQGPGGRPAHGGAPGHRSRGRGLRPRHPRQHLRGRAGDRRRGQDRPGPVERREVSGRGAAAGRCCSKKNSQPFRAGFP